MIAKFLPLENLSVPEIFFAQKSMELVYSKTIDSYRARLHNPLTILIELQQVIKDIQCNKIKSFDITIEPVKKEALEALESVYESELTFGTISKEHFIDLVRELKKDQYQSLEYALQIILNENTDYCTTLFSSIRLEIERLNGLGPVPDCREYLRLSKLLNHLFSGLLSTGYAKEYLYKLIHRLFNSQSTHTFAEAFDFLTSLSQRESEDYNVIFCLKSISKSAIGIQSRFLLDHDQIERMKAINDGAADFFRSTERSIGGGATYYLGVPCSGQDYFSVIREGYKSYASVIDVLHLGFPTLLFETHDVTLVVGTRDQGKAAVRRWNYFLDGSFRNNQQLYNKFTGKLISVLNSENVSGEAKSKLISAVRYLRLGWEVSEHEQKFVNFWIGLEYIFSNYDIEENTIKRMKRYFVHAHSLSYLKRNLYEFHNDILRLRVQATIPGFHENLEYLKNSATYDFIIRTFSDSQPLLVYRAERYKQWILDHKERKRRIKQHQENLERHLARLYRVRNEIVHDANIHSNIAVLTGNLRYYLTFVLNSLLEYMTNEEVQRFPGVTKNIDDFFVYQGLLMGNIERKGYPLDDIFNVKSVTEIFK